MKLQANNSASSYIENLGNGHFKMHALPVQAQLAPLYAMVAEDFNHDGNLDIAINGNDFGTEVSNGRYDALNGLVMLGDGKGNFSPLSVLQSGLYIPGDGKALIKCRSAAGDYLLAASQNNGPLKVFRSKQKARIITLQPTDKYLLITLKNGQKRRQELYTGDSFLSQSARFIITDKTISSIEVMNYRNEKRIIQ